jgi:hypothetical protein
VGHEKRAHELAGDTWDRRHGKELQEPIESENNEDNAQKNARYCADDFHFTLPFKIWN